MYFIFLKTPNTFQACTWKSKMITHTLANTHRLVGPPKYRTRASLDLALGISGFGGTLGAPKLAVHPRHSSAPPSLRSFELFGVGGTAVKCFEAVKGGVALSYTPIIDVCG